MMKTRHLTLILLLVFVFALATGCAGKPKSAHESGVVDTSETTEDPVETKDPEIEEEPELVWSHKHEDKIYSVVTFGETVAVGELEVVHIHHLSDGSLMDVLTHQHAVEDMEFSADGTVLGAGQGYYGVQLTELTDNAEPLTVGSGYNSRLAFSPDGLHIATGNRDGVVWIWELDGLTQTATLENPDLENKAFLDKMLVTIDYHPSGKLLATTYLDDTIYIWDIEKKEVIQSLQYGADATANGTFRFSPNGSEMAYAVKDSGEQLIRLITVDGGDAISDIVVPERVMDLNFSPDGRLLAVASYQATTIWDVTSGELIYTLNQTITPPDNMPTALTFTPDGGHLAVVRWDETIELWRLPGAEPIA